MKTIYKSIFVIALGIISLNASAQKDSTLIRQVLLERDYNPTLQDASKINTMPSIYTPVIKPKELKFVSSAPNISLKNNQLGAAESGDINTNVGFSKKRGYLDLGAGTHSNLEGAAGYRIVNTTTNRLDISATHSSTSSTLDFIDGDKYTTNNTKAKYSASKINLKYQHIFEPSILSFGASYYNTSFNYYGNSFIEKGSLTSLYDVTSRQNVDIFNVGAGLKAREQNEGALKYEGNIRYQNFKSKYGITNVNEGPKGGQLSLDANFFADLGSDKIIGVRGDIMNQSFSNKSKINTSYENAYHGFTNITATPYIGFEGANWNANLGLNVSALLDIQDKFFFSPNISAEVHVNEVNTFYGTITGGVNNNTYLDILQENRYANLATRIGYSKTLYDIQLGFKSGAVSGLEFDIFAGYKKTDDDHLYMRIIYPDYGYYGYNPSIFVPSFFGTFTPLYANVSTGHVGGLVKTKLIPYTDLSAKFTTYFYNVKNYDIWGFNLQKKAWGRPTFTTEFNVDVKPIDALTLSLSHQYAGGRKSLLINYRFPANIRPTKMKDINELNLRAEYQITDWVSANVRLNNILNQKYELQYGYPLQGFNVLGGLSFKF